MRQFCRSGASPAFAEKRHPVLPGAKNAPLRLVDFARDEIYENAPDRAVLE